MWWEFRTECIVTFHRDSVSVPWLVCGCRLCIDFLFCNCFCLSRAVAGDWKKKRSEKLNSSFSFETETGWSSLNGYSWINQEPLIYREKCKLQNLTGQHYTGFNLQNRIVGRNKILRGYPKPDGWKWSTTLLSKWQKKLRKIEFF